MHYLYTIALNHLYLFLDTKCGTSPACVKADNKVCINEACVCDDEKGWKPESNASDAACVEKPGRKSCIRSLKYSSTICLVRALTSRSAQVNQVLPEINMTMIHFLALLSTHNLSRRDCIISTQLH